MDFPEVKWALMYRATLALGLAMLVLSALLWSCSESSDSGLPAGEMQLISVTPVGAGEGGASLLRNGDFAEWWAGAPAPTGFQPPFSELSTIERIADERVSGFAVVQQWHKPDRRQPNRLCFQAEVELEPNTQYTLQLAASTDDEFRAPVIFVLERKPDGGYEGLALPLLALESYPDLFRWYEGSFVTKNGGRVVLLVKTPGEDENLDTPRVIWHSWQLYKTVDAPALPQESERPVLFGVSAPKVPDGGTITPGPGEGLSMNGWIVGGSDATVRYQLDEGPWQEAELVPRPDIQEKYPDAPVKTGWRIQIPPEALPSDASISVQLGAERQLRYRIQATN